MKSDMGRPRTSRLIALVVGAVLPLFLATGASADDADVLPKSISHVSVGNYFYPFATTHRFNKDGDREKIANAFDGRRLDSTVFPTLLPPGQNLGTAFVDFSYDYNIFSVSYAYGITNRLSGGIEIPYYYAHNRVKARLDPTGATLGASTGPGPVGCTAAIIPRACPNSRPFTTEDIQQLLGSTFGFRRVESFTDDGLGDITALFKYQYLRTEDWRLAASLGARFPTGREDDPDNLADIPWSPGNYAILLRLHNDYVLSNLWKKERPALTRSGPIVPQTGDLIVNFTFRYDWNLSTDVTVRISDASSPITTNKERVTRKYGDKFELELGGRYYLLKGLSFSALYRYGFKLEDVITGSRFDERPLEDDTDSNEHIYIIGANYSLLPLYLEKRFPIPLSLSLTYRDRFAGRGTSNAASPSQVLNSRYINLTVSVPF